jgi:hypothetical protein
VKVAGRADDKLEGAVGQNAGLGNHARQRMRHIGRHGRGLGDDRSAGQQSGGELFQHPPAGEIERIDMHRDAVQRRHDVLASEAAGFRQRFHAAIEQEFRVR